MNKVLIVTYYWPPAGGPGVQRILKFAKYLPEYGWEPIILTIENGEYPAVDETLLDEIPGNTKVYKSKAIEPFSAYKKVTGKGDGSIPVGVLAQKDASLKAKLANFVRLNLIIPDAKIGWIASAVKQGQKIIDEHKPDLIFSSSPPPSVHLIAKKLSKRNNIRWVADLRDPWSKIHYYTNNRTKLAAKADEYLEKKTLAAADAVTTVSRNFSDLIQSVPEKTVIIPNGFDEPDFSGYTPLKPVEYFTISYIGGLNENRFYPQFFEALKSFTNKLQTEENKIKLLLAGKIQDKYINRIEEILENSVLLQNKGYLTHPEAIEIMFNSDLLVLFLEKVSNYSGHIPGKIFEYLRTGKYILGIGKNGGEVEELLELKHGGCFRTNDSNLADTFRELFNKWKSNTLQGASTDSIDEYSRKNLTKKLTGLFDSL